MTGWNDYRDYWDAHWRRIGEQYFVTDMDQPTYDAYNLDIFSHYQKRKVKTIFDLGCGTGLLVPVVRQLWPDAKYTGLDICKDAIEAARAKYPDETWIVMDGPKLPGKADLIIVHSVFTHIGLPDTELYLDVIRAALNPGGRASLSIHIETDRDYSGSIGRMDHQPAFFESLLHKHGFAVLCHVDKRQRCYEVEPC